MDDTNLQMLEGHILMDPKNNFWAFVKGIKMYDDIDLNENNEWYFKEWWLEEDHVPVCEKWSFLVRDNDHPYVNLHVKGRQFSGGFSISEIHTKSGVILSRLHDLYDFLMN